MSTRDLRRNLRRITAQRSGTVGLVRWLPWSDLATPWSRVDQITMWEQAWITKWLRQHPPTGHVVEVLHVGPSLVKRWEACACSTKVGALWWTQSRSFPP